TSSAISISNRNRAAHYSCPSTPDRQPRTGRSDPPPCFASFVGGPAMVDRPGGSGPRPRGVQGLVSTGPRCVGARRDRSYVAPPPNALLVASLEFGDRASASSQWRRPSSGGRRHKPAGPLGAAAQRGVRERGRGEPRV